MLKNYLKIILRGLKKYRIFSFINITGLSIGIASCILIFLFIQNELSYDSFYKNSKQIYRVALHEIINNADFSNALTPAPLAEELRRDYPQVINSTRINFDNIRKHGLPSVRYGDKIFNEGRFYLADSTYFEVFNIPFIKGNYKTALTLPNSVVLTKSTAEKYFGSVDVLGKVLRVNDNKNFIVTGVVNDIPPNSHFHFDLLGSLSSYKKSSDNDWLSSSYYTYIVLQKGTSEKLIEKILKDVVYKYVAPQITRVAGVSFDKELAAGNKWNYFLQPLTSIHLHSHLESEFEQNGDITNVYIFSAIALLILLIACVNFMNMSTARSEKRAKEVGIRKTLGSSKGKLIAQFFVESILMSFIAVAVAVVLVEIFFPVFNNLIDRNIQLNSFVNLKEIPLLIGFAVFVGFLSGCYPAFYLSKFTPAHVLKKDNLKGHSKSRLRSILVIFQFSVSIILFIGTFIIYKQLNYIQNKKLGFNKEHVIIIKKANDIGGQIKAFENELLNNPGIINVSNSSTIPGVGFAAGGFKVSNKPGSQTRIILTMSTDNNFAKTYKIKMAEGRYFSKEHPSDTSAVVINSAAAKAYGLTHPIGKYLVNVGDKTFQQGLHKIIGVTKDFNFESLRREVRPLVIFHSPEMNAGRFVSVRVAAGDFPAAIDFMKATWEKFAGDEAFDYDFFDQVLAHFYKAELRTGKIITVFSILAMLIACLGLLGLAAFVTEQRTKEIGIRKTLGATVPEIMVLLSKEFIKWILIANIIAWPVAYLIMHNWLDNFAYRININLWIFLLSGVIALLIALATVSTHAIKAATANPIKSLRYE